MLTSCQLAQTKTTSTISDSLRVACQSFRLIKYHGDIDSPETVEQIRYNNAVYRELCTPHP